jgi:malonyl-CoA/methylmalonyl-CoA synthetase
MPASPLLARWLARAEDQRTATRDAAGPATWRDLVLGADRLAAGLLAGRSSLDSERVALLVSPGAEFVQSLFGVLRAGGAAVVISPLHPPPETRYLCDDARVTTILASPDLSGHVAHLAARGPLERRIMLTPELLAPTGSDLRSHLRSLPRAEDAALQLYTSGTTGKPKGVVITHANVAAQQELLGEAWGLCEGDVLLHVLPLHHMHGLAIALLPAIGAGASTLFLGGFDARATWEAMGEATVLMAVPTIHAKLFAAFDAADEQERARWRTHARRLRLVTSGSAALPVSTGRRWEALTGAYPLERFGMTEIGVGASNPLASEGRRPGTVGRPLRTVNVRVIGEDGRDADSGELWVAGPSVFAEYQGRPDETRDAFVADGGQRWFKTGDTVARDSDGYIRILGRTSVDILKSGGYRLSALEIEEVLREHGAIAEVAVVGVPDETWGDRVVACLVAREGRGNECVEDRVRAFAKERLAPYKVPRQVVIMADLPRNALGQVVKSELVRRLSKG